MADIQLVEGTPYKEVLHSSQAGDDTPWRQYLPMVKRATGNSMNGLSTPRQSATPRTNVD